MASAITNRGKLHILTMAFQNDNTPSGTHFYVELLSGTVPTNPEDLNTYSDVSSNVIAGKTASVARDTTDWNVETETDGSTDTALIQIQDLDFAGAITGATGAILTDRNGTAGSRIIYAYWDLGGSRSVSAGQTLTLQDLEIKLNNS